MKKSADVATPEVLRAVEAVERATMAELEKLSNDEALDLLDLLRERLLEIEIARE